MAIIQWNMNGLLTHLPELQQLISKISPSYICIQETRLNPSETLNLRKYTSFRKDRQTGQIASGRVAILVENSIYANQINLNSDIEAIAITTIVPNINKVTLCNIYLPPNYNFTNDQLESLIQQLPRPFILLGDFNSHNTLWGSTGTNSRGRKIETLINDNLTLLNDGSPTHFCANSGNFSAIDLCFSDATLASEISWEPLPLLWGSHHFPIKITFSVNPIPQTLTKDIKKWRLNKGDWDTFRVKASIKTPIDKNQNINEIVDNFTRHITQAAEDTIGYKKIKMHKKILHGGTKIVNTQRNS